jgi:copper(I)-binding protein
MRRTVTALVIATLAISLTGCGAGNNASTRQVKQVTDGVEATINTNGNNIKLVNVLVVATTNGAGVLVGTIVNEMPTEDALLGVSINGVVATVTGTNTLAQNTPIIFEGASANSKAAVSALGATAGQRVAITMFFAHAGQVSVQALVRDASDIYAGVTSK